MPTFSTSTSIQNGLLQLKLNGRNFLVNSGRRSANIQAESHYVVQWFVRGVPGSDYSIEITSPHNAVISITRRLRDTGIDYGGFSFRT
jgi:hypothetical protein